MDPEMWEAPVSIGPEPLALVKDVDKVSEQYQNQGFAFFRPATLPPFAAAVEGTSVAALAALDKDMEKRAKTSEWEKYVLEEIVEKGKLGSERVKEQKPNPASKLWNKLSKAEKDKHGAFPLFAMNEEDQVCHRWDRDVNDEMKHTTMVFDARARSSTNDASTKPEDLGRKKPFPMVHADASLSGLYEITAGGVAGLLQDPDTKDAVANGAYPNLSYGGVYPALGYFNQFMATNLPTDDERTVFEKLIGSAEVADLATGVCGLQEEDIKAVAARRLWGDPFIARPPNTFRDIAWILGYMVSLGVVADPAKVCGKTDDEVAKCRKLPAVFINKYNKLMEFVDVPKELKPTTKEVEEVVQYFEKTFMGAVTRDRQGKFHVADSPALKWGCFWARLRLADAFNLWMNLTPPQDKDKQQSAAEFLQQAHAIKNPLAAIDPFSLEPKNTNAGQIRTLQNHEDTPRIQMQVRPQMYYAEVLYFNTNVVLHTAMHDSNKELLRFGDARTSIESRVVVLERCYRRRDLKNVQSIRAACYQGEERQGR
eukprot:g13914.t1